MVTESDLYALEKRVHKLEEKIEHNKPKSEEGLCYSCVNKRCWLKTIYGNNMVRCDHYKMEE